MQEMLEKEKVPLTPYTDLTKLKTKELALVMDLIISYAYLGKYQVSKPLIRKTEIFYSMLIIANYFANDKVNKFLNSFFMQRIATFVEDSIQTNQEEQK